MTKVVSYDFDKNNDGLAVLSYVNGSWSVTLHYFIDEPLSQTFQIISEENSFLSVKLFHMKNRKHLVIIGCNYIYFVDTNKVYSQTGIILNTQAISSEDSSLYMIKNNSVFNQVSFSMGSLYYLFWSPFCKTICVYQDYM